jgi:hypothetical protein
VSHAKVAVSIHRASDGSGGGSVSIGRRLVPYSPNGVAFAAALVAALAFGVYLRTMLPSTGFWDTGEAQTVPATLSIFHPTGFPVYSVIGWAWSQIPVGDVAWRMNLLSAVSVALAAGLVTLIAGHLVAERHRILAAAGAFTAGVAFAFASEPWENATRADVHALNILFVTLVVWLLLTWGAAVRAGSPRAGRWLVAAAGAFGLGMGTHPLIGISAFGIAAWLLIVDPGIWRRWRLVATCAAVLGIGIASYGLIFMRASIDPAPPLFYAHPDTWERFRYLVFAEQFHGLFSDFGAPLADLAAKWNDAERVLAAQFVLPGWIVAAAGATVLAVRRPGQIAFLALVVVATTFYAMNFRDGDIDRYYLPVVAVAAALVGVAVAAGGAVAAAAVREVAHRLVASPRARRRLATVAGGLVVALGLAMPAASLVGGYAGHDQSANREADAWVASVHRQLPPNAVVISWWSYSTPLWYHRWVLGERPDVTIIDERNILDDGYRTMDNAIRSHLGERPVYVVPPHWDWNELADEWEFRTVSTYPGYIDLLFIEGPRQ